MFDKLKRLFLILLLSAAPALYAAGAPEHIKVRRLGVEQGLSHYTTNCFLTDEFGILWIGTGYGLNRVVDGNVDIYTMGAPKGMCDNSVLGLCSDRNGHVFIRGAYGLSIYDQRKESFNLITEDHCDAFSYTCGRLYFSKGTLVSCYDVTEKAFRDVISLDSLGVKGRIHVMAAAEDGSVYLGTSDLLMKVSPDGKALARAGINFPNEIMLDSKGFVWVSMRQNGILRMTPGLEESVGYRHDEKKFSPNFNNVRSVIQTGPNTFLTGSYGGLSELDPRTGKFSEIDIYDKYYSDCCKSVRTLYNDGIGSVYIGSVYEGAFTFHLEGEIYVRRFLFKDSGSIPGLHTLSVDEDRDGNLWFCTSTAGLYKLDEGASALSRFDPLRSANTKACCYDPTYNCLWVGTVDEAVFRIDLNTNAVRKSPTRTVDGNQRVYNIISIVSLNDTQLLLGTSGGIMVLDKRNLSVRLLSEEIKSPIWDMLVKSGEIWALARSGVIRYNLASGEIRRYSTQAFNCFHADSFGRIWLGSKGQGLYLYDEKTDSFVPRGTGLPIKSMYITDICDSPEADVLLVGANRGLFLYDSDKGTYRAIDYKVPVNDQGLFYSPRQTRNFVCTLDDAYSFDKGTASGKKDYSEIRITDLFVNNVKVVPGDETRILSSSIMMTDKIRIKTNNRSIDFRVSGPKDLSYIVEPSDGTPRPVESDRMIHLGNLKSGPYRLVISSNNPDAPVEPLTLAINMVPPFYKSPFLIGFLFILLMGSAAYFFMTYLRRMALKVQLEKEKNEKENLEKFNKSKLDFFTNVSHEFKTPLTIIGGLSEVLLEKNENDKELSDIYRSIGANSERLKQLIDELIDFRKKDSTLMRLNLSYGSITAMCRRVFDTFLQYAEIRKVKFVFDAPEDEIFTWFDQTQLEKVIFNLLSNAFKFTKDEIRVSLKESGGFAEIRVRDNGTGIPEEEKGDLFTAFKPGSSKNSGTGLGLAFSKDIAEAHNGSIEVESNRGSGAVFKVRIPVHNGDGSLAVDGIVPEPEISEEETNAPKENTILIIDDNPDIVRLLKTYFSRYYYVRSASNAMDGIHLCESVIPDLILADVMMDGLSGIGLCRQLKSAPQTSHIPILLISACTNDETILEGFEAGADDYVTKPFSLKVLHSKCIKILEARRAARDEYIMDPTAGAERVAEGDDNIELLRRAEAIIDENISNPDFAIPEFAKMMGLSRTYLFTKIKGITGLTPNDFIINRKLKMSAAEMLKSPSKRISDIAYEFGFSAPSYFSKCFKDIFGQSPAEYRKSHGE